MAKPLDIPADQVLQTVLALRAETDRGAAVLGGSMVENALGHLLGCYCGARADKETVGRLFDATGPLSSFSQRILVARAFGLIDARKQRQLGLIREIRNHFAHHPLEASFNDSYVRSRVERLPFTAVIALDPSLAEMGTYRTGYLVSCASHTAKLQVSAEHVATMFPRGRGEA